MSIALLVAPFLALGIGAYLLAKWLIKKSNAYKPLAFLICLLTGGIIILGGFLLLGYFLISPIIIMIIGGFLIIIGGGVILTTNKQELLKEEKEYQKAKEKEIEEEKNYSSYAWLVKESNRILTEGKIDDSIKFHQLLDVLNNNRKYEELKQLSNKLKKLEEKEEQELSSQIQNFRKF